MPKARFAQPEKAGSRNEFMLFDNPLQFKRFLAFNKLNPVGQEFSRPAFAPEISRVCVISNTTEAWRCVKKHTIRGLAGGVRKRFEWPSFPGSPLDKALLEKVRLVNVLKSIPLLAQGGREGFDPDRAAIELLDQGE